MKTDRNLVPEILAWFKKNKRDMPWRRTKDPYRIWISEIMLQQTQVKTATPYYERWVREFPSVKILAEAPAEKILKLWEGLGYYTRARNIHKAAKLIVEKHGSRFPSSFEKILELPGIGRYTAGAVASIAFGIPVPVLDGNVMRVLARLFAIADPVDSEKTRKALWKLAESLIPARHPGNFNEGMMELGATICLPREAECLLCPVPDRCMAYRKGIQDSLPRKGKQAAVKKVEAVCAVIKNKGSLLIERRPEKGLWANLWQLPTFPVRGRETPVKALEAGLAGLGIIALAGEKRESVKRSYTVHQEKLHVFCCRLLSQKKSNGNLRWAGPKELDRLPFSSAYAKILKEVR